MTDEVLVALPIALPLVAAALGFSAWRWPRLQAALGVLGSAAVFLAGIALVTRTAGEERILTLAAGGWPDVLGVVLVADVLGAAMVCVSGLAALASSIHGLADDDGAVAQGPLTCVLLAGACGAFLTNDLFNLYVWFEVLLMASFVLLSQGGARRRHAPAAADAGALSFVALNLVGSALFLAACGLVYAYAGTLNLAELRPRLAALAAANGSHVVWAPVALLGVAFGVKAGLIGLHAWLPVSYPTPSSSVAALFAGLSTKVGVYALLRTGTLLVTLEEPVAAGLLAIACATMLGGVLGAVVQTDVRRILSMHIISQIGYMVAGIGLLGASDPAVRRLALTATVFYVVHHIVVKTNLFLIGGAIAELRGTESLDRLGGLAAEGRLGPWLAALFAIPALSLAGLPPMSGFWAKLGLIQAGLAGGFGWVVLAMLLAGLLTLVSMLKIWSQAFARPAPAEAVSRTRRPGRLALRLAPSVALALVTLALGLAPQSFLSIGERAADQLLEPSRYVRVVSSGGGR